MKSQWIAAILLVMGFLTPALQAQYSPETNENEEKLNPEEEKHETMLRYMESALPGPEMERLLALSGNWSVQVTFWSSPDGNGVKSKATASIDPLMGGRFIQLSLEGELGGFPYESLYMLGFDSNRSRYYLHLFDTMGKQGIVLQGNLEPKTKRIRYSGSAYDSVLNTDQNYEVVLQFMETYAFRIETTLNNSKVKGGSYRAVRMDFTRE